VQAAKGRQSSRGRGRQIGQSRRVGFQGSAGRQAGNSRQAGRRAEQAGIDFIEGMHAGKQDISGIQARFQEGQGRQASRKACTAGRQAFGAEPACLREQAVREGRSGRQAGQIRHGGRQAGKITLD
jgi:hypothetical protein